MMHVVMEVYFLILALSIIQSLFGVGLLLFGTPIMLLMGYQYTEILMFLLPASISVSYSQVLDFRGEKLHSNYRILFFTLCVPVLLFGLYLSTKFDLRYETRWFVSGMLLFSFVVRVFSSFRSGLQSWIKKNIHIVLFSTGLIHGVSNMGGSILGPTASSLYSEKNKILASISLDYAIMASIQLLYLTLIQGVHFKFSYFLGAALSLMVRSFLGKRVFHFTSEKNYQTLLNGFILANAVVLVAGALRN